MRAIMLLTLTPFLWGCASPNNLRTSIGAGRLGDASQEVVLPSISDEAPPVALVGAGPSITGLDRSDWESHVVLMPIDHTEHHAHLTDLSLWSNTGASGIAYPTLETALGQETGAGAEILEWLAWPFEAGRDIVLVPARLVGTKAGLAFSPHSDAYERTGE